MHAGYTIPTWPGGIVVFMADDSFLNISPARDPRRHYERMAAGVSYVPVPGNHDSMLHAPDVAQLAPRLRASLTAAMAEPDYD
jgi:thioesterase domain-containing protein